MTCDCRQRLLDAAAALLVEADRVGRNTSTSNAERRLRPDFIRRRAMGYGAAAGLLAQEEQHMTEQLTLHTITPEIERDRYGRPMVMLPDGTARVPYRRCTTFVGVLEDTYNLARWQQRNVALGLADRPDLLLSVAAHRDDKERLNRICEDASEAAKGHAAATTGTALHALTETVDRGLPLPVLPVGAAADIDAYRKATADIEWLSIETGVVIDELRVHGTPDRVGRLADGRVVICDLKTGSIDYGMGKIAMQLAMYAHGVEYEHVTAVRKPAPYAIDQTRAVVIHLPAGQGRAELIEVDITAGWEGVHLAAEVWSWRARRNLSTPLARGFDLLGLIGIAATVNDLTKLWTDYRDIWTPAHTDAATSRKTRLLENT